MKKIIPFTLASVLAVTPFLAVPKAFAVSDVEVEADDSDVAGEDSDYTINFTIDNDLEEGDTITITFDEDFDISSSIDESDVEVDGEEPKKVKYSSSSNSIKITLDDDYSADDNIEVTIQNVITNPSDDGKYEIEVETSEDDDDDSDTIKIVDDDDSSDDDYSVTIGDDHAGESTTYKFGRIDLGSDELEKGEWVTVVFPDKSMVPTSIDTDDVEINGYKVSDTKINGAEVDLKVPRNADGDDTLTVSFLSGANITNPDAKKDYVIKVKYDGTTYYSESFDIAESSKAGLAASLSTSVAGAYSSYYLDATFGGTKLKSDSQIRIDFPAADLIPTLLDVSHFTINGKTPQRVTSSGNAIYLTTPSSFDSTNQVKVNISDLARISNPKMAGNYTLTATVEGKAVTSNTFTITGYVVPQPVKVDNSTATVTLTNSNVNVTSGINIAIRGLGQTVKQNTSFIEVALPAGFKVPSFIQPSAISVNSVPASLVTVRGQNVLIYPATDLPAGTPATIAITPSANVHTPVIKGLYTIGIFSSEEQGALFSRLVSVVSQAKSVKK